MTFQDGQYNMDLSTLLFIAGQGRGGLQQANRKPPNAPQGPCYNCKSYDHWARDCPGPRQPRPPPANQAIPALSRYCLECGITHLVTDCPLNPDQKGKAPVNTVNVIPSPKTTPVPSGEESEGVKPVNVVTRAQARNNPMINKETQTERSSNNTWKARRQRQKAAQERKLQGQIEKSDKEVVEKQNEEKKRESSILAGQILEPLRAMLEAFEARLKPNQTLEDRIRAYPDPQLETKRLEIFQKMIEDTQALLRKQLEATRPCEGHAMKLKRDEPLLDGQRSQIPPNKSKMESP